MCVENESSVRPSTRVPRTLADIGRPALPSTYKHTPRSFWAHPDGSAVRKRNARTVIVVAGAVTAAHDPPTRAADASRLSARCHQLSSKPARASHSGIFCRFRRFKRRLKRTGPRPDDEHGPRIRFEFHDWAFVCIGSTVTTLRPDFRASGTPRSKSRRLTGPNAKSVKILPRQDFGAAVSARLQNSQNSQKPPAGGVPGR